MWSTVISITLIFSYVSVGASLNYESKLTANKNICFVKYFHVHLTEHLVHLINLIFKTKIVSTSFKITIITPIYKSGIC